MEIKKKWKQGKLGKNITINNKNCLLNCEFIETTGNAAIIEFSWEENYTFGEILENTGSTPIPPYLNRKAEPQDKETYQTVYSKTKGSVAAPTAGLHFTDEIIKKIKDNNISTAELTLHVGAGTFKPVKTKLIAEHEMHTEHFFITVPFLEKLTKKYGNITAVGTTSLRSLESLYHLGIKIHKNKNIDENELYISQWEIYDNNEDLTVTDVLKEIKQYMQSKDIDILRARTQIMIVPGYKFRIINRLITNFHQPKSTLLLLIAAVVGNNWTDIYNYAKENNFRFLSYGDSSLLELI